MDRDLANEQERSFTFAEFFAGIGLMRIGLEKSGQRWKCMFANDLDETKRRIYAGHFGSSIDEVDGSDVHVLSAASMPTVDLATASFPCTDLSVAGAQAGIRSGESSAFWGFQRVLNEMGAERRPPVVLIENVVGFLTSHGGRDFRDALLALNQLGYRVDPFILDARWFVPQSRQRMFVVGVLPHLADGDDGRNVAESRIRPGKLTAFIRSHASEIDWSIRELPEPPLKAEKSLKSIVQDPPIGHDDWWNATRVDYFYNQMFPRHQEWIDKRRHASTYHYATAFRRVRPQDDGTKRSMAELRTDGIAGCLRTPKGGSARQILVRVGRGRLDVRLLSADECASLMGADGYRMVGTLNQALFGFGDAVCVDAVSWIATNYLHPLLTAARDVGEPIKWTT
ncbi:MAG: DNA cytosine methyltransferase [Pirellulales bacterium]